jgi:hypothetical protein
MPVGQRRDDGRDDGDDEGQAERPDEAAASLRRPGNHRNDYAGAHLRRQSEFCTEK